MKYYQLFGYVAAVLTTFSFLPQAIKIIRTKSTHGISLTMYIVLNIGVFCWLIYGIFLNEIPIILANAVTGIFSLIILVYRIKYKE